MPKYTIKENVATVEFTVKPNGASNLIDVKGIKATCEMDLSLINPDGIDIPEGLMSLALKSAVIDYQRKLRDMAKAGDIDDLNTIIDTGDHKYLVGEKVARSPRKSIADSVGDVYTELRTLTNNKCTKDDVFDVITKTKTKVQIVEKYTKK